MQKRNLSTKKPKGEQDTSKPLVIFGLGNPGDEYVNTRHNIGFNAIENLCEQMGGTALQKDRRLRCKVSVTELNNRAVCLVQPQTFMNLSGR